MNTANPAPAGADPQGWALAWAEAVDACQRLEAQGYLAEVAVERRFGDPYPVVTLLPCDARHIADHA